ncbi:MAG: AtuA-related protein, partial [Candidatus Nanopelagicales bacterium]
LDVDWAPTAYADPETADQAQSLLRITVRDADPKAVAKPFTTSVIESTLASYPGMFPTAPPGEGTPYGVYWPTTVDRRAVPVSVAVDGEAITLPTHWREETSRLVEVEPASMPMVRDGEEVVVPLGTLCGARSGDKGGDANVGLWIPAAVPHRDEAYAWLHGFLTPDRVRELLPEAALLGVDVHPLPNLHAVNVVIHGLLGRGVAETARSDPQAKGLGEHLRARLVSIPRHLLPDPGTDLA